MKFLIYNVGEQTCNEMVGRMRGGLPRIKAYMYIIFINGKNVSLLLNTLKTFIAYTNQ